MTRRRSTAALLGAGLVAGVLIACSFGSLDYLQNGEGVPEGGSEEQTTEAGGQTPIVLVPNQMKPAHLAQDEAALYWVDADQVMTVAKAGGMPRSLGKVSGAKYVAVDADPAGAVYLAVGGDVVRMPKDGGGSGTIFKGAAGAPQADTVVADDTSLFLLQYDENIDSSQILKMAKDGGGVAPIEPDSGTPSAPSTLTIDTASVVWLDTVATTNGAFFQRAKGAAAGSPSMMFGLGDNDDLPTASNQITVDNGNIYWVTDGALGTGRAAVVSRKRETSATLLALYRAETTTEVLGAITADATNLYVIETTTNSIIRVLKAGGAPGVKLASGLKIPTSLVVDATSVYVTLEATVGQGAIIKLAK